MPQLKTNEAEFIFFSSTIHPVEDAGCFKLYVATFKAYNFFILHISDSQDLKHPV